MNRLTRWILFGDIWLISLPNCPLSADGRLIDDVFEGTESLYQRFVGQHYVDGNVLPAAFDPFRPEQSVNRGKYSDPVHVLHPNCCDGMEMPDSVGVLEYAVKVPTPLKFDEDGRVYDLIMRHTPQASCYAHAEISCTLRGTDPSTTAKPPKSLREKYKVELARVCRVAKPPMA